VNPRLHDHFKNLQPFTLGRRYQRHWLWLLQELWNADKHRSITFVSSNSQLVNVTLRPQPNAYWSRERLRAEVRMRAIEPAPLAKFQRGSKLGRFLFERLKPRLALDPLEMEVSSSLRLNIQFRKTPPTYGENAMDALDRLHLETAGLVSRFEHEFF